MNRRIVALGAAGAAGIALVAGAWVYGPGVLREMDVFEIQRVEITGARLLTPAEVLSASGVRDGQNLWDDRTVWVQSLLAHGGIESARVTRRAPGTLRIRVEEKQPVAYVEAGALRLATGGGELLPADPSRAALDLPIVRADWTDSAGAVVARRVLAEAGRLSAIDPSLIGQVSEIRAEGEDAFILSHRLAELIVPAGADPTRIAELRAVLADLEARAGAEALERTRIKVDLRFRDQIVVRFPSSV